MVRNRIIMQPCNLRSVFLCRTDSGSVRPGIQTGKFHVGDYGNYDFEVTPKMIEETKHYIASKNYPKPSMDVTKLTD